MNQIIDRGSWQKVLSGMLALAALAMLTSPAGADVITYNDGKVLKGLIEEHSVDPQVISMQTENGRVSIPRSRVANIQKESKAQGYLHLGDAYRAKQKFPEALKAYQQALQLEPGNEQARAALDATQGQISQQQMATREGALQEIDKLSADAQQLIGQGKFDDALKMLEAADKRVPSEQQKKQLRSQISNLYLAWANEREDKLDQIGAEEKLKLALAADPDNSAVIEKMLKLWETNPDKREQVTNVYETMLERHPEDDMLRKKLADLYYQMNRYEDATHHYLELYKKSDTYQGTQMEDRIVEMLDRLHRQYARTKDYDKAIEYYEVLSAIDDETDPTAIVQYEYLKAANSVREDDFGGQLKLAQFAEQNGMDEQALSRYRQLVNQPATKAEAASGIERYAQRAFSDAEFQFKQGNFELAAALADQVRMDFPGSSLTAQKIPELIGKSQIEAEKNRRQSRERAKDILARADEFYQQASMYFNQLFSTERVNNPYLASSREEAKRYYRYAIQAYEDALRIDPTLGTESNSLVSVRLNECRTRLRTLTGGTVGPSRFGTPINTPQQSIPPMNR